MNHEWVKNVGKYNSGQDSLDQPLDIHWIESFYAFQGPS